jgi:hypothetical protein
MGGVENSAGCDSDLGAGNTQRNRAYQEQLKRLAESTGDVLALVWEGLDAEPGSMTLEQALSILEAER